MSQEKKFTFQLGADPEFNFIHGEKRACAESLFKAMLGNKETLDLANLGYTIGTAGNIGWDGQSYNGSTDHRTGELRPSPSFSPAGVIKNMKTLFERTIKNFAPFDVTTLSNHAPLGGHIHFELTEEQKSYDKKKFESINKILSSYYIPLLLGDDNLNCRIRLSTERINGSTPYGLLTDHRISSDTFEFRSPSAEWITTPKVAEATLAYMGVVWHEITKNPKSFIKDDFVYRTEKQGIALQSLLVDRYAPTSTEIVNRIKKRIKTFEMYPLFKEEIEYILNTQRVLKEKKDVNYDIRQGWAMALPSTPTKRNIHNKRKIEEKLLKANVEFLSGLLEFRYNQDMNVNIFVNDLKKRLIAFDWKLKHKYVFFGLKKGINDYFVQDENLLWYKGTEEMKTGGDINAMQTVFARMRSRLFTSDDRTRGVKTFLIGIPYDKRLLEDSSSFIDLIHELERNVLQATNMEVDEDADSTLHKGELYKIYNQNDDISNVAMDTGHHNSINGRRLAQEQVDLLTNNQNVCVE